MLADFRAALCGSQCLIMGSFETAGLRVIMVKKRTFAEDGY